LQIQECRAANGSFCASALNIQEFGGGESRGAAAASPRNNACQGALLGASTGVGVRFILMGLI